MSDKATLLTKLTPVMDAIRTLPPGPDAQRMLTERFPVDGPALAEVRALLRAGFAAGWLGDKENGGVRFSRVLKADGAGALSIDFVHMSTPGPGHTHPNGEFDLCFATDGAPTFDGNAPGWTVYAPGTWHVPTVKGGTMDILYFLPGGAIRFEPKPG